jgi:uncharacterized protein YgiM (DUF1202 family)
MVRFLRRLTIWVILILVLIGGQAWAGDSPFAERPVVIGTIQTSSLPPIKPGERITGTVDVGTSLNIRTGPWGDVIGSFGPGDRCVIVGQVGDWYKIEYKGRIAYVHSAYVRRPGEGPKPFPRQGWVNSALGLKVRRVPHGDVIGKLKDQQHVEILGDAGDYYKIRWGDNEAFVDKRYIDTDNPAQPGGDGIEPMNFTGYVSPAAGLNVRTAPWGSIVTALPQGAAVKVTGKVNDWYRISFNGKTRYVHASYIVKDPRQVGVDTQPADDPAVSTGSGTLQERIVRCARSLIGSTRFRGPEVDYGNKACAQVASTALKNAGAMNRVVLNVRSLVADLKAQGWREVSVPPFKEGDVITWKTYDYTGDGVKDPDTHVGIIVKEGNTYMAMNNSSRLRMPRLSPPYSIGPVTRVLRKP